MSAALVTAAAGFALLVVASGRFVKGAAGVALRLEVPAVVVGAVIVGFGTSAPELLASVLAATEGARGIAVGNIVGSNLANLTLVLGIVALLAAPAVASRVLRRELPLMLAAMAVLAICLSRFSRWSALVLLAAFGVVAFLTLRAAHVSDDPLAFAVEGELADEGRRSPRLLALETGGGLLGTVVGAHLLVSGARSLADLAGLGEGLVGFTLVALGTSLPEVVTCVQAGRRGDADLAIGNVVGSNLFNSLAIGGITGLISPGPVLRGLTAAAWIAVVVALVVAILMTTSRRLTRWEGVLLVGAYLATIPIVAS
ncbi:MAG: calcium/sodium antiporter [Actinomycetota bacterium]|nr:calcium/sodium antiporter [Actinomycetota bacterium]